MITAGDVDEAALICCDNVDDDLEQSPDDGMGGRLLLSIGTGDGRWLMGGFLGNGSNGG